MSASQDKKRRQTERMEGTDKRTLAEREAAIKAKKERTRWGIVGAIIVVFAVVVILLNTNLFYSGTTAVTIGDHEYTNADFQYYYTSAYSSFANNYGDYLSLFFDSSQDLDDQAFNSTYITMMGGTVPEGVDENSSWKDYFKAVALQNMVEVTALYDEAVKAGYELTEEQQTELDEAVASFDSAATMYGLSDAEAFVSFYYGKGNSVKSVSELMRMGYIASGYAQEKFDSFEYTQEELDAYYDEHADELDAFTFSYYLVSAEKVETTETVTDEETGEETEETTEAVTDETMAEAKETAERILEAAENGLEQQAMSFAEAVTEVMGEDASATEYENTLGVYSVSYVADPVSEWVVDAARAEGDMTVIESEGSGYYVVYYGGRSDNSDYNAVSFRHILINADDENDDGEYSTEELGLAEDAINEIYDEWKNGDATEESFAELANANSEDSGSNTNGGLYEHVGKNSMVDVVNDFIFDPDTKPGDTTVVLNEGSYTGWHLIYFVGTDEMSYHNCLADYGIGSVEGLRQPDYNTWRDEMVATYTANVNSFVNWFAKV